jgi:hypothetical protein
MGYLVSALVGVGLIVLTAVAVQAAFDRTRRGGPSAALSQE